jgi:hypothetical protein
MPRIHKTAFANAYLKLEAKAKDHEEKNDCAVKAVALATGASYEKVHKLMEQFGRKKKQGTFSTITRKVLNELGFKARRWPTDVLPSIIQEYPKAHRILKNVTTHHPRRFPKAWEPHMDKVLFFETKDHVACFRDGKMHDWSINNRLHVQNVYEITPL